MTVCELLMRAKEALLEARDLREQRARLLEEKSELVAAQQCAVEEFRKSARSSRLNAFLAAPLLPERREPSHRAVSQNCPRI